MKTTKEILTAMECCESGLCRECPYEDIEGCEAQIYNDSCEALAKLEEENRALRTELAVNGKSDVPDTNVGNIPDQTAKQDDGTLDPTLVPIEVIWAIANVRRYGLTKYKDRDNYKRVEKERLRAAAFRHFLKYLKDPSNPDEESGLPNLWHCVTNLSFLCEMENEDGRDISRNMGN